MPTVVLTTIDVITAAIELDPTTFELSTFVRLLDLVAKRQHVDYLRDFQDENESDPVQEQIDVIRLPHEERDAHGRQHEYYAEAEQNQHSHGHAVRHRVTGPLGQTGKQLQQLDVRKVFSPYRQQLQFD